MRRSTFRLPLEPPAKNNDQFAIFPGPNTASTCNSATQETALLSANVFPREKEAAVIFV